MNPADSVTRYSVAQVHARTRYNGANGMCLHDAAEVGVGREHLRRQVLRRVRVQVQGLGKPWPAQARILARAAPPTALLRLGCGEQWGVREGA
jgi:hypothetical protein